MKKLSLILGLALVMFLLSIPLVSAKMECMKMRGPEMGCRMMQCCMQHAEELGLTAEQQSKMKDMGLAAKKEQIRMKADMELAKLDLNQLLMADNPNENEVMKAIDNLGLLKTKMRKAEIKTKLAMQQILTKEQLAKWKEIKKECCEEEDGGMGCMQERGAGRMQKKMMIMKGGMMGAPEQVEVKVEKCMKK